MVRTVLAAAIAAAVSVSAPAMAKDCRGVVLKDSCQAGGDCPDGPTWHKGESRTFMAWNSEDGHAVLVEYRIGAILADNVRLAKGCALPRYTD